VDGLDSLAKLHALRPQNPAELFDTALTIILGKPLKFLGIAALCALGPSALRTLVAIGVYSPTGAPADSAKALVLASDLTTPFVAVGLVYVFASRAAMASLWEHDDLPPLRLLRLLVAYVVWLLPYVVLFLLTWGAATPEPVLGVIIWFLVLQFSLFVSSVFVCAFPVAAAEPRRPGGSGPLGRSAHLLRFGGTFTPYLAQLLCGVVVAVLWIAVEIGSDYLRNDTLPLSPTSPWSLTIGGALTWVAMSVACTAAAGIPAAAYLDARIRREGLDVVLVLDELERAG